MTRIRSTVFALLLAAPQLLGCSNEIGDPCTLANTECPERAICISSEIEGFPGGYCTIPDCGPGTCPEEALCVAYRSTLSDAPSCNRETDTPRLRRSYCMRACDSNDDCRAGYSCLDPSAEGMPWGAVVLEDSREGRRVCTLSYEGAELDADRDTAVCEPPLPLADAAAPPQMSVEPIQSSPADGGAVPDSGLDAAASSVDSGLDAAASSVDSGLDATTGAVTPQGAGAIAPSAEASDGAAGQVEAVR